MTARAASPARHGGWLVGLRLLLIVVFAAPLAFMVLGALRRVGLPPPRGLEVVPEGAGLGAFRRVGEVVDLPLLLRNSALVVAVAVPLTVAVSSWTGFALVQLADRPRRLLLAATLATLLVPPPMLWVARFVLYLRAGMLDTLLPLMAPALAATTPFTVLIAYRSFRRVPPELWQAARLEGASALGTWWRVGLPLVRSTTAAIAAIAFAFHWGNYIDALLYVRPRALETLPLGLARLAQLDRTELPVLLAGAVILAVPPLLALLVAQRPLLTTVDLATER